MTTHRVALATGEGFAASDGETLLAAAQRAGWLVPFGCRNGNCGACVARLVSGTVAGRRDMRSNLIGADEILLCATHAGSDLQLALNQSPVPGSAGQIRRSFVTLVAQTPTQAGEWRLAFDLPPGRQPVPQPGQYLLWEPHHGRTVSASIDIAASRGRRLVAIANAAVAAPSLPCKGYIEWPHGRPTAPPPSSGELLHSDPPAHDPHARL